MFSPNIASPLTPALWASVSIPIARCLHPPKIDGRIDDPAWATATHVAGFYPYGGTAPIASAEQTEAWVCADRTRLYIAFRCLSPGPIRASETARNGDFTHDDFVGVDIDSEDTHTGYSTFMVNARGTQYQTLEGGTAQNITWAGDWVAATHITRDGYTAEMAIPFALMRYRRGASAFGLLLYRQVHGQIALEGWPYVPLAGANNQGEPLYMAQATDLAPAFYAPRPIYLPYMLASAGEGSAVREGIDIKAPISTTLTGVASFNPDFETIEQEVENINFSYTPKLLTDNRPFFAEGAAFLPDEDLFYSRQIGQFAEGLKLVGKQENTTIGLLGTNSSGTDGDGALALNLRQDLGPLSDIGLQFTSDDQRGLPANRDTRLLGGFGWRADGEDYTIAAEHTQSYLAGSASGTDDSITLSNTLSQVNRPYFRMQWLDIGPDFASDLGYLPEVDKRGEAFTFGQTTVYGPGRWALSNIELDADDYEHPSGGFFHSDAALNLYAQSKSGWLFGFAPSADQHEEFHDSAANFQVGWGKTTLFQQGNLLYDIGHEDGQRYEYVQIGQGILVSRPFDVQADYSRLLLGSGITAQAILTGTYRITSVQTIGGRIVAQGHDTDIYLSFGQQVRAGADIFVLFGDPNSARTRGRVAVKVVRPL